MPDVTGITYVPTHDMHKHNSKALEKAGARKAHRASLARATRKSRANLAQALRNPKDLQLVELPERMTPNCVLYAIMMQVLCKFMMGKGTLDLGFLIFFLQARNPSVITGWK